MNKQKQVYVFLSPGFEEIEAITPVDILRRGGVDVKIVSITKELYVQGAHNIKVACDCILDEILDLPLPDAIIFPGGMPGATNLANCVELKDFSKKCLAESKLICAICASPAIVFGAYDLLKNKKWTCYPNMENNAPKEAQNLWCKNSVVVDGKLISSRGPGTASLFAYTILEELGEKEKAQSLKEAMLF